MITSRAPPLLIPLQIILRALTNANNRLRCRAISLINISNWSGESKGLKRPHLRHHQPSHPQWRRMPAVCWVMSCPSAGEKNAGVWVQSQNYACAVAHALTMTGFTHQGGKWIQSRYFFYADQHETWLNDEVEDMETWVQRKEHSTTELSADLLTVPPVILHKSLNH